MNDNRDNGDAEIKMISVIPIISYHCREGGFLCLKNTIVRSRQYWMAPFKEVWDWGIGCRCDLWSKPIQQCNEGL